MQSRAAAFDDEDFQLPAFRPKFSYASDELSSIGQAVVRGVEFLTGQPAIKRLYLDYSKRGRPPELFWQDAINALRLRVELNRRPIDAVPATGPLVVIANHPFGVVDGVILCWLVSQVRSDFRIMTHRVLHQAPEVRPHVLPIDFSGTEEATRNNVRSRQLAKEILLAGGVLIVFPGGGVAYARSLSGPPQELIWKPLAARLALTTGADVLPATFSGSNSRLYHLAANIHQTLKYAMLFHEVRNKIGARIELSLGDLISHDRIRAIGDSHEITRLLWRATVEASVIKT
jgi:putative hemolysin